MTIITSIGCGGLTVKYPYWQKKGRRNSTFTWSTPETAFSELLNPTQPPTSVGWQAALKYYCYTNL